MDAGTFLPDFTAEGLQEVRVAPRPQQLLKNGVRAVHEAFADYMLINPGCRLREMAAYFGYTVPWICTVINSDMFKAYFASRRGEINVSIAEGLPQRLLAAGHLATERLIEVLESTNDSDTIIDSFDKVLHRLGYAPNTNKGAPVGGGAQVTNNNVFFLDKGDLADARQLMIGAHVSQAEKVINELTSPTTST